MKSTVKYALMNSLGTAAYIVFVVSLIFSFVGRFPQDGKTILIPIAMLMLFVFSAAFTGTLVFGRPIIWYLNGKKKEAISLLLYTLGIFLVMTLVAFTFLIIIIG